MKYFIAALMLAGLGTEAYGQSNPVGDAPSNAALAGSSWPNYHGGPARQASTEIAGPREGARVQKIFFKDVRSAFAREGDFDQFGPSPWLNFSDKAYNEGASATTVWGSTLQYIFKFSVDGDEFKFVDKWKIQELPMSCTTAISVFGFKSIELAMTHLPEPRILRSQIQVSMTTLRIPIKRVC